jgi:hypothetical protein
MQFNVVDVLCYVSNVGMGKCRQDCRLITVILLLLELGGQVQSTLG